MTTNVSLRYKNIYYSKFSINAVDFTQDKMKKHFQKEVALLNSGNDFEKLKTLHSKS